MNQSLSFKELTKTFNEAMSFCINHGYGGEIDLVRNRRFETVTKEKFLEQ